jgi:hypothetical protein
MRKLIGVWAGPFYLQCFPPNGRLYMPLNSLKKVEIKKAGTKIATSLFSGKAF